MAVTVRALFSDFQDLVGLTQNDEPYQQIHTGSSC